MGDPRGSSQPVSLPNWAHSHHLQLPPHALIDAVGIDTFQQEDVGELMKFWYDFLDRNLRAPPGPGQSAKAAPYLRGRRSGMHFRSLFFGATTMGPVLSCGHARPASSDEWSEIQLPLQMSVLRARERDPSGAVAGKYTLAIEDLLDRYFEAEVFDGDNKWACEECGGKVDAKRVSKISTLPPYLSLDVGRYAFNFESMTREKLPDVIDFPVNKLDVEKFATPDCVGSDAEARSSGSSHDECDGGAESPPPLTEYPCRPGDAGPPRATTTPPGTRSAPPLCAAPRDVAGTYSPSSVRSPRTPSSTSRLHVVTLRRRVRHTYRTTSRMTTKPAALDSVMMRSLVVKPPPPGLGAKGARCEEASERGRV